MMQRSLFSSLLIQICLAALAVAAPVAEETLATTNHSNSLGFGTGGGILGLVVLILDIIVFVEVLQSSRPPGSKLVWCLVVFFFPIVGLILYWLFSDRAAHRTGSSYEPLG